jgi:hypothetical protein
MKSTYNEVGNVSNLLTPEFRRLITWMRLLTLGALAAVAGLAGMVGDPRTGAYGLLAIAGALLATGAWSKLRPLLQDSQEAARAPAAPAMSVALIPAATRA